MRNSDRFITAFAGKKILKRETINDIVEEEKLNDNRQQTDSDSRPVNGRKRGSTKADEQKTDE